MGDLGLICGTSRRWRGEDVAPNVIELFLASISSSFSCLCFDRFYTYLRAPLRRRLAGAEGSSRVLQMELDPRCHRVRASKHAARGPFGVLERLHCLAEIVGRGAGAVVERRRVTPPQPERDLIIIPEDASRHGYRLAQQCLGFFETP